MGEFDNTEDTENYESSDSEEDIDDVYTEADDSDDSYESDEINDDSEESEDDEIESEISESEDENLAHSADDDGSDEKEGVDADCDGYRMECNEYAECAQMTSGSRDGLKRMGDGYLRIGRAAQAGDGRNEQMNVFRSRVIYVDDIKAMLTNPMWLSGVVLLLLLLAARPMYSCWARREYKRLAPQMDVENGYQSCV